MAHGIGCDQDLTYPPWLNEFPSPRRPEFYDQLVVSGTYLGAGWTLPMPTGVDAPT